jgi:hypothetical protein
MLVAPAIMIFRNTVVIDKATISTNLGVTMRIGAGPETSGGYQRKGSEVPCPRDEQRCAKAAKTVSSP